MINLVNRRVGLAAFIALAVSAAAPAVRADDRDHDGDDNRYLVTNLVSDLPGKAAVTDPHLKNSWGVTFSPAASPFWISDNATGLATLYDGDGTIVPVVVTILCPTTAGQGSSCPTTAAPTGTVWNPTTAFLVPGTTTASHFIFATEDGTISAWASGAAATIAVNNSTTPNAANGAVYKGLAVGVNVNGVIVNGGTSPTFVFLYATNFRAGTIDVFRRRF